MTSIYTAAFAFMSPEAIRVFLQLAGYRVSVFDGSEESLDLRTDKPDANIVILPNFAKRNLLATHAGQIGRLVVLTNGRHENIIDLDIPILDSNIDGDVIQQARDRTPYFYTKKIKEAAVPLNLEFPEPAAVAPVPSQEPDSLDSWFEAIDHVLPEGSSFDHSVEYPVCQYLVGELSQKELQGAMRVLVKQGADKDTLRGFYLWLTSRAETMSAAMQAYLLPKSESASLTIAAAARKFKVDATDIALLESVYQEMQQPTEGDDDEEEEQKD